MSDDKVFVRADWPYCLACNTRLNAALPTNREDPGHVARQASMVRQ